MVVGSTIYIDEYIVLLYLIKPSSKVPGIAVTVA